MNIKTVVITGATGGIGCAAARLFAQRGYNLVLTYNNNYDKAVQLYKELSLATRVELFKLDLNNLDEVEKVAQNITKLFSTIDVLVNNAGIAEKSLFTDLTNNQIATIINTNLVGTMVFSREIVKKMLRTQCGNIINISSIWGEEGASMEVHYSAAKAGLIGFTKALAKEVAPMGIRVNAVAPGAIETNMIKGEDLEELGNSIPLNRVGKPEEVAEAILYLSTAEYVTGSILSINGGGIS